MPLKKLPVYRLTLKPDAVKALATAPKKPFRFIPMSMKGDMVDVMISFSVADQLMTFAKAGENLSDTVMRLPTLAKA